MSLALLTNVDGHKSVGIVHVDAVNFRYEK